MPVPSWAQSGAPLIIFLFFVVSFRAQGTYWLGRAVPAGLVKAQDKKGVLGAVSRWLHGPTPRKGAAILERWGIVVIPLCFLTVGLQTAVLAGSGLVQMRWRRFTLAMLPGAIAWAFLYGLGMLAVWVAAIQTVTGSPWAIAAIASVALIGAIIYVVKRASSRKMASMEAIALEQD